MGIRSAFNPLGAMPFQSGYTVTWTVDNIIKTGSSETTKSSYLLPTSWLIDGSSVALSAINDVVTVVADSSHSGCYVVTLSYSFDTGTAPATSTVYETDANFDDGTAD